MIPKKVERDFKVPLLVSQPIKDYIKIMSKSREEILLPSLKGAKIN